LTKRVNFFLRQSFIFSVFIRHNKSDPATIYAQNFLKNFQDFLFDDFYRFVDVFDVFKCDFGQQLCALNRDVEIRLSLSEFDRVDEARQLAAQRWHFLS
jgi:hypothetical protein